MIFPGLVEMHVHTAPDVRARSLDDLELAREAARIGAKAVVIKSHHMLTADRAIVARSVAGNAAIYGGVTLNPSVGGLNPAVVDVALRLGGKIVWLPTLFAVQHRRMEGKTGGIVVVEDGRVVPAAREIFSQIAAAGAILATGHQSPAEIRIIAAEATALGVRKILINHPEHKVVGMTLGDQKELRREFSAVFFERCFSQPSPAGYVSNIEVNARAIAEVGVESTVIATDAGQIENPPWAECWSRYLDGLSACGIREADIKKMAGEIPARLLAAD